MGSSILEFQPHKETLKDIMARMKKAIEEKENKYPQEMAQNREIEIKEKEKDFTSWLRKIVNDGGFSEHHISLILKENDSILDETMPIINKVKVYAHEYNNKTRPWLFVASRSGSGKTTAIHKLIFDMLYAKQIVAPGYIVHSDFIESCFNKKAKVEDLYKYDLLVIDDFFKKAFESGSIREQDIIKKMLDYFYRFRKTLIICADVPIDIIHERLDKDEYADQICYRIIEKCGYNKDRRFIYGWNNLPNLRK